MRIETKLDASDALKHLGKMQKELEGKQGGMYDDISRIMAQSIRKNFAAGGRPPWKKRVGKYSHPILDHTGKMRDDAELSAKNWKHLKTIHRMEIKTIFYGAIHQLKGMLTRGKPVIRKFVQLVQSEKNAVKERIRAVFN